MRFTMAEAATDTVISIGALSPEALAAHDSRVGSVTVGEAFERGVPLSMLQGSIPQELIERGRALGLEPPPREGDHGRAATSAAAAPGGPGCSIRPAAISDAATISAMCVRVASAQIDTSGFTPVGRSTLFEDILGEAAILGELQGGAVEAFVCVMDGAIVGFAARKRPLGAEAGAPLSHVRHMYVERSGAGIGKRLWGELHFRFEEESVRRVTANSSANAVPFYERLGFRKEGGESDAGGLLSQLMVYTMDADGE